MTTAGIVVVVYLAVVCIAAYVRFWTEGGYWYAIHTGRTFMLQATTLTVGVGFTYLDQLARSRILRPLIQPPIPKEGENALRHPLGEVLSSPEWVFAVGVGFLLLYLLTGYNETRYLAPTGNPAHPRKYISSVLREPTVAYKRFIAICLWFGSTCLLIAFYCLGVSVGKTLGWFVAGFILPAHLVLLLAIFVGPVVARRMRGSEGTGVDVDLERIPERRERHD